MSLQIQPRALDIENDFNIIQGIILNILILSQQPWRFSAKFWDAAVTTLQKLVMFFSPQLFPRNAWLKIAGSQHLVKKMMWIGFHPGAAAVFRVTIKASKTKKERGNLKCKEWWDGHVFVFLVFARKQTPFFPHTNKNSWRLWEYSSNIAWTILFVAVTCFLRYSTYEIQDGSLRKSKLTKQLARVVV